MKRKNDEVPLQEIERLYYKARNGDAEALGSLLTVAEGVLRRDLDVVLEPHVRALVDMEDVIQETHRVVTEKLPGLEYRGPRCLLSWIAKIAENEARVQARKERRRRRFSLAWLLGKDRSRNVHQGKPLGNHDLGTPPETQAMRQERYERLIAAFHELDRMDRQLLRFAMVHQLTPAEIGVELGLSPPAASMRLLRALRRLRESFGDTESFGLPEVPADRSPGADLRSATPPAEQNGPGSPGEPPDNRPGTQGR